MSRSTKKLKSTRKCIFCGAEIGWLRDRRGWLTPVDNLAVPYIPDDIRGEVLMTADGRMVRGVVITRPVPRQRYKHAFRQHKYTCADRPYELEDEARAGNE